MNIKELLDKAVELQGERTALEKKNKALQAKVNKLEKQLRIGVVSQQRELLLAYDDWHFLNEQYHSLSREEIVDKYLEANNCG